MTEEQTRAINSETSCVVAAGAGSGKTSVLSERFVHLIKEGKADCDRILTITFTKKATTEMKDRIHKKLVEYGMSDQLKLFPNAWISTVDSFCADVVRTDCYRYGFSSGFSMLDEDEYKAQAKRLALEMLQDDKNSSFTSELLKYTSVESILSLMQNLAGYFNIVSPVKPKEESAFVIQTTENEITENTERLKELLTGFETVTENSEKFKLDWEMIAQVREVLDTDIAKALQILVFSSAKGEEAIRKEVSQLKKQIAETKDLLIVLIKALQNTGFIQTFYHFIADYEQVLTDYKKMNNSLSFSDVMQIAIDILTKNKAIRRRFKEVFKFVMIDEFQDNNDDYRKILFLLCEKQGQESDTIPDAEELESGKVFLVGDEKQSIYRFRGADVSVFKKMSSLISQSGGQLIELTRNFRSEPSLVEFFNILFSNVMKDNTFDYEAGFKTLKGRDSRDIQSRIVFNNYIYPNRQSPKEDAQGNELCNPVQAEAFSIAKMVTEMVSTDKWLICEKDKSPRRPRYNEIAILFKSLTHQGEYEKALRLAGIPYSVAEARATFLEAVVNDFYSLLNLSVYPNDRISEIAVSNSPFGGNVSAVELAEQVSKVAKEGSIAKVIDYMYYTLGYRRFIVSNPANQVYEEHYDWLFSLAKVYDGNGWNLVKFLDYLRPLLGTQNKSRELTVQREENLGVQIMTIHKSKGLEFPIVIVANMNSSNRKNVSSISYSKTDNHLLLPVFANEKDSLRNLVQVLRAEEEDNREKAELKRLLYVATTRAENHLVFSSSVAVTKTMSDTTLCTLFTNAGGFDFETNQFTSESFKDIEIRKFGPISINLTYSKQKLTEESMERNLQWYSDCIAINPDYSSETVGVTTLIQQTRQNITEEREELKALETDSILAKHNFHTEFGTYVHYLIECDTKGLKAVAFENDKLTDKEISVFDKDAHLLAENFINSSEYKEIIEKYPTIYSELRFQLYDSSSEKIIEGSMDMVCENKDSVLIIDFKTDSSKCPIEHKAQLDWYKKAGESLFKGKEINTQVVYLREKI